MPTVDPNPVAPAGAKSCPTSTPVGSTYTTRSPVTKASTGSHFAPAADHDSATSPSMTDRLKEKVGHLGDKAHQLGDDAKHAAQDKLEHAKESAAEYFQQGREKATELTHTVENYVRSEPTKSLLGAAGVGFVLGFLLIRR